MKFCLSSASQTRYTSISLSHTCFYFLFARFGPNADAWHWLGHPSPTSVAIPGFHTRQPDDVFSFLRDSFPSLNRSGRAVVDNVRNAYINYPLCLLYVAVRSLNNLLHALSGDLTYSCRRIRPNADIFEAVCHGGI